MEDSKGPAGHRRWLPHFSKAGAWFVATVATAAVGAAVSAAVGGWFSGDDDAGAVRGLTATSTATPAATALPFPPSRLVSQDKIGLYHVEIDGSPDGALSVFGRPTSIEHEDGRTICTMYWRADELRIRFYDLGGGDACQVGDFCDAHIAGRDWATTRGLQPGESARRIAELYPEAERVQEPGAIIRWVLEEGVAPCGQNARGGLEAWTGGGRVSELVVTYLKGGD